MAAQNGWRWIADPRRKIPEFGQHRQAERCMKGGDKMNWMTTAGRRRSWSLYNVHLTARGRNPLSLNGGKSRQRNMLCEYHRSSYTGQQSKPTKTESEKGYKRGKGQYIVYLELYMDSISRPRSHTTWQGPAMLTSFNGVMSWVY